MLHQSFKNRHFLLMEVKKNTIFRQDFQNTIFPTFNKYFQPVKSFESVQTINYSDFNHFSY